jgi:hypothetical protein
MRFGESYTIQLTPVLNIVKIVFISFTETILCNEIRSNLSVAVVVADAVEEVRS